MPLDFSGQNLRGRNFKGHDLTGANVSYADIRGANFTNTILKGANFTGAKAGIQRRWLIAQQVIAFGMSMLSGALSASFGVIIGANVLLANLDKQGLLNMIVIALVTLGTVFVATLRQGFKLRSFLVIAGLSTALTVFISFPISLNAFEIIIALLIALPLLIITTALTAFTYLSVIGFAIAVAVAKGSGKFAAAIFTIASTIIFIVFALVSAITFILLMASVLKASDENLYKALITASSVTALTATATSLFSFYTMQRFSRGDKKFALIPVAEVTFGSIGGTSFRGANLTEARFNNAILRGANFNHSKKKSTNLTKVCWKGARDLSQARVGNSILADPKLRDLLVVRCIDPQKVYVRSDLRDANLEGVDLECANLQWADLSDADLKGANLKNANLTEVLALGADFSRATLTGACLEAWNIDSNTNLEGVDCQYVYLLRNQQERRPSSGDFAPGEFTKLFQEALNTLDLIFRNGVDWKAFVAAFQTVQVENDGTELTIQSIENKGDGVVVVRVSVPETADKAKLHSEFNQNYDLAVKALEAKYHAELKAKDDQITIYREKSADMKEILGLLASRPVTVEVNASAESKAMTDSTDKSQTDKSQTVSIGGNVTGSTINLGAISGSVSNVVNQLPSAPDPAAQPGIKELLIELQAAIESDADLPEKGKVSALEQVKLLAEVAQDPEQLEKKGLGSQAITFFKNAASFLPDTAKLAEACTKLLPLITKALGLPF